MKIAPLAALALALTASGCMTLEERRALDMEQCRGYGFRQGTDAFAQCMQTIDVERAAARRTYVYQDFGGFYGGYSSGDTNGYCEGGFGGKPPFYRRPSFDGGEKREELRPSSADRI